MPSVPFVDTHVHLWDPMRLGYDWLAGNDTLDRRHELPEFAAATAGLPLESMVFMECAVNAGQALDEARWVTTLARLEPRLKGMVASAPLEQGEAVRPHLEALAELPLLRGIRRLLQSEADDFCLQPGFVTGARMLAEFGLSFDICIFHRQLANVIAFADKVETVPMILDHIGKPGIADGLVSPWAEEMRELARRPNVVCKISGVATEADHRNWTEDQLKRYVSTAIDAFGFDRVMFGGDWPVSTLAITYRRWTEILDDLLAGASEDERRKFWRDNAVAFYRL
ncbi:MAG: amidohydrolase family protein [Bosea sp.]|nr:amidohydrolase family protein [Bosea sp. (in: a-proteobacteria)]